MTATRVPHRGDELSRKVIGFHTGPTVPQNKWVVCPKTSVTLATDIPERRVRQLNVQRLPHR
jgi:hypothetical protein